MSREVLVISVLVFLLGISGCSIAQMILTPCELAQEMDTHGAPRADISRWVYIAEFGSNLNTELISPKGPDGYYNYSLFQLSGQHWCQQDDGLDSSNICDIDCNELVTSLKASIECAMTVKSKKNWTPWDWMLEHFVENATTSVEHCFEEGFTERRQNSTDKKDKQDSFGDLESSKFGLPIYSLSKREF